MIDAKILLRTGRLVLGSILGESPQPVWAGGLCSGRSQRTLGQRDNAVIPSFAAVDDAWLTGLRVQE